MSFAENIKKYMDVVIQVGLNIRAGQRVIITASAQDHEFVRVAARAAYQAGAEHVEVVWNDPGLSVVRLEEAPEDSLEITADYLYEGMVEYGKRGDALLSMSASNPDLYAGQDPQRIQKMQMASAKKFGEYRKKMGDNTMNWCVIQIPNPPWAQKIFPEVSESEAIDQLWDAIFKTCRIDMDDPVAAWKEHIQKLENRSDYLNERSYTALQYSAPGTDLTVGLPEGHIWKGGSSQTVFDIEHVPNLPTEEVFTLPHKDRVDGVVHSSLPLNLRGMLVEDFSLTFENGRVVDCQAAVGEEHLKNLIETDEGAAHLGEVALVPHSSPISQMGFVFFNTLYDENASCHLALGRAYRETLENGVGMEDEDFAERGGNDSNIHVDFMIGSGEMDIDGVLLDGSTEPLIRAGEWVIAV